MSSKGSCSCYISIMAVCWLLWRSR